MTKNRILLKEMLYNITTSTTFYLMLFKNKKESDNYEKNINHLLDLAKIFNDDSIKV
jgi:hypothetical protein